MDYLVSIERTAYFHWQIELLIESFRHHNLQDSLVIAIADGDDPFECYLPNFYQHERKFLHANNLACKNANKFHAISAALQNKLIQQPFVLIHPDMILMKPLDFVSSANILFHDENYPPIPEIAPHIQEIAKLKGVEELPWLSVGGVMRFQDVPVEFFDQALQNCLKLKIEFPEHHFVERAAWILTIYEWLGALTCEANVFEITLMNHDVESNFIHYKYGIPPMFNKHMFRFDGSISTGTDPYDVLLQNNDS